MPTFQTSVIIGLVANGNIPSPGFQEPPLFERDNIPVPHRLRNAAARLASLSLVRLPLPFDGLTFSDHAWEIIRLIEAGVQRSNVIKTYQCLIPGLSRTARDDPSTPDGRALRRFRGMVMAHGFVFQKKWNDEIIVPRPPPPQVHDL